MLGNSGHRQPDDEKREAVMVATTYPMKPRALGENLGGPHFMKRRKSQAWKKWPSSVR